MTKATITIFLLAFVSITTLNAQNSIEVEAKELKISHITHQDYMSFDLMIITSDGTKKQFRGRGAFFIPASYCDPCSFPRSISSDGYRLPNTNGFFFNSGSITDPNAPSINFTVSESESDPIVLRPTILSKRKEINIVGNTSFRGNLVIRIGNTLTYIDNNVELSGTYFTKFFQETPYYQNPYPWRSVSFRYINYSLAKPE
jgi:hypothetical protein